MNLHSRENMLWLWLDPMWKLHHHIVKCVYGTPHGVDRLEYTTYCRLQVTVDDVNPRTKIDGFRRVFVVSLLSRLTT